MNIINQEKLEKLILEIRKENPENKIFITYGGGNKVLLDSELKINDGILTVIDIIDEVIRYIDVDSIYEVVLNKD